MPLKCFERSTKVGTGEKAGFRAPVVCRIRASNFQIVAFSEYGARLWPSTTAPMPQPAPRAPRRCAVLRLSRSGVPAGSAIRQPIPTRFNSETHISESYCGRARNRRDPGSGAIGWWIERRCSGSLPSAHRRGTSRFGRNSFSNRWIAPMARTRVIAKHINWKQVITCND